MLRTMMLTLRMLEERVPAKHLQSEFRSFITEGWSAIPKGHGNLLNSDFQTTQGLYGKELPSSAMNSRASGNFRIFVNDFICEIKHCYTNV